MIGSCIIGKDGKEIKRGLDPDTEMTKEENLEALKEYHQKYQEIFGYISDKDDFSCTWKEYIPALLTAIKEKKDISEYLKKRNRK